MNIQFIRKKINFTQPHILREKKEKWNIHSTCKRHWRELEIVSFIQFQIKGIIH